MIDPAANEAALRFLAAEVQRLELLLAQTIGNLALANKTLAEANGKTDPTFDPASVQTSR